MKAFYFLNYLLISQNFFPFSVFIKCYKIPFFSFVQIKITTFSVHFSFGPSSFVLSSVIPFKASDAFSYSIDKIPCVNFSISPFISPIPVHFISFSSSAVAFSIISNINSIAIHHIISEIPCIRIFS